MKESNKPQKEIETLYDLVGMMDGDKLLAKIIVERELHFNEASGFGSFLCTLEKFMEFQFVVAGTFLDRPVPKRTYAITGERATYNGKPQIRTHLCELTMPTQPMSNFYFLFTIPSLAHHASTLADIYQDKAIDTILKSTDLDFRSNQALMNYARKEPNIFSILDSQRSYIAELFERSLLLNRLMGLNLSKSASRKIFKLFGHKAFDILNENPYILLEHYEDLGYGLDFCDKIAQKYQFTPDNPKRLEYGIIYALIASEQNGNVYLPKDEFIHQLVKELTVSVPDEQLHSLAAMHQGVVEYRFFNKAWQVDSEMIRKLISSRANFVQGSASDSIILYQPTQADIDPLLLSAIKKKLVVEYKDRIYRTSLFMKESYLFLLLNEHAKEALKSPNKGFSQTKIKSALSSFTLEKMQEEACVEALTTSGVSIVTGPAGSGKSFTIRAIMQGYMKLNKKSESDIILLAPTGRAAKRIQESTNFEASTIHRGLGMDPDKGWHYCSSNPLPQSLIIVDEFSMVDTELAFRLFDAIKMGSKVVLIGDTNQLPSVGPGNVLSDMIASGKIHVTALDVIKRQQENSDIIENSVRVINRQPLFLGGKNNDSFVIYKSYNDQITGATIASVHKIMKNLKANIDQIQVLIPQRKSKIGTYYLNYLLQKEFNDAPDSAIIANQFDIFNPVTKKNEEIVIRFRKGDKVINIKNNYSAKWFNRSSSGRYVQDFDSSIITNGEIGIIEDIVKPERGSGEKFTHRIIVKVDDKFIFFDDDFESLEHAYAVTVHKSQGSQWRAVIYLVAGSHRKMLTNNLMYTAMTRPSEFLAVIGDEESINYGIENDSVVKRYSTLCEHLTTKA